MMRGGNLSAVVMDVTEDGDNVSSSEDQCAGRRK
jgi:hypothetical protein